jgi:hypothetical protein
MTRDHPLPHLEFIVGEYSETESIVLCPDYLMFEADIKTWRPLDHT